METFTLNPYGLRFWKEWQLDPGSGRYNTPLVYIIRGEIDIGALQAAVETLIAEYMPAFKSTFAAVDGGVQQTIWQKTPRFFTREIIKRRCSHQEIQARITAITQLGFDLVSGPCARYHVLCLPEYTVFIASQHHINTDAVTGAAFNRWLAPLYLHYTTGQPKPERPCSYQQANHDACMLAREVTPADRNFWLMRSVPTATTLPYAHHGDESADGTVYFSLDAALTEAITHYCQRQSHSWFSVNMAVFGILLSKYLQSSSLTVQYPVDIRQSTWSEVPGCFINLLHLSLSIHAQHRLDDIIHAVHTERCAQRNAQHIILPELYTVAAQRYVQPSVSLMQTFMPTTPLPGLPAEVQAWLPCQHRAFSDLNFAYMVNKRLVCRLDYRGQCFSKQQVWQFALQLRQLYRALAADPMQCLSAIDIRTQRERRLWSTINATTVALPNQTLTACVQQQIVHAPSQHAVATCTHSLTYAAFGQRMHALAQRIAQATQNNRQQGIAILLPRGIGLPIALQSVLVSGNYFIPLNTQHPLPRLREQLSQPVVTLLITTKAWLDRLVEIDITHVLCISDEGESPFAQQPALLLQPTQGHEQAYLMFTSGSTGAAKAVRITEQALRNVIFHFIKQCARDTPTWLSITTPSFDIFLLECFIPLSLGGCHWVLPDSACLDAHAFARIVREVQPDIIQTTPSRYQMLLDGSTLKTACIPIILCGGEPMDVTTASLCLQHGQQVFNVYGPTETTIWSCASVITRANCTPIGFPIANTQLAVRDTHGTPAAVGIKGQLHLSGLGLALGYLDDARTEAVFYDDEMGTRWYDSGDWVKLDEKLRCFYCGRNDEQIKINGHRLEPEQMITWLLRDERICRAHLVFTVDNAELVLYYQLAQPTLWQSLWQRLRFKDHQALIPEAIKAAFLAMFPISCCPKYCIPVTHWPLTAQGKIDVQALPQAQSITGAHDTANRAVAQDLLEHQCRQLWQTVLQTRVPCTQSHFFALGGDSLRLVTLMTQFNAFFQTTFPVSWFFRYPSILAQAQQLRLLQRVGATYQDIVPFNTQGDLPPLFLIHPGLAGAEVYAPLAEQLSHRIPVYGIDSYNMNSGDTMIKHCEQLAAHYLTAIQPWVSKGPVVLAGWSMGGTLAYEMAQQLVRAGQPVAHLLLLDTHVFSKRQLFGLENMISLQGLEHELPEQRGKHLINLPEPYVARVLASLRNDIRMLRRYRIKPYAGKLTLLKTTEKIALNQQATEKRFNGWDAYVADIQLITIGSHHYSLLEGENLIRVAEHLNQQLCHNTVTSHKKQVEDVS